jgi:DNA replication protein
MSNMPISQVVAKFNNERLDKIYQHEKEIDNLPGMREIKIRKKQILQSMLSNSIYENGIDWESELDKINQQELKLRKLCPSGYSCTICNDKGFIDGNYCSCLRDLIYTKSYGALDISSLEESFEASNHSLFQTDFKCVDGSTQSHRFKLIENYAKKYADKFPATKKSNLFLTGNTGLGKTYILRSIAKHVYQKGEDVMLIGASDLFSNFYQHRMGMDVNLEILWNCGFLLIDDLGIEPVTHNVTVEYFLDLLNRRIDSGKHTAVATNLSTDGIVARYGERVYSRIRFKDICDQLVFEGQDIRLK